MLLGYLSLPRPPLTPGYFGGACANCKWRDHGGRCSVRDGEDPDGGPASSSDDDGVTFLSSRQLGPPGPGVSGDSGGTGAAADNPIVVG